MKWTFLEGLHYTRQHEWARQEKDGTVTAGITDYAQDRLGKIVFVELPEEGRAVKKDEIMAVLESVKTVADVYAPADGTVSSVNEELLDRPELINEHPYESGWIVKIKPDNAGQLGELLTKEAYENLVRQEEEESG